MKYLVFFLLALAAAPALAQNETPGTSPIAQNETPGTAPIALVEEAYLAHRKGDFEAAIMSYTSIIQRRGLTKRERAISYLLRGEAKRDAGRLDEAVQDFTRALRQWPGYPQAHFFRGRVYERQGKLLEAYADIGRASQLDPVRESYQTSLTVLRKRMEEGGLAVPAPGSLPQPAEPRLSLEEG